MKAPKISQTVLLENPDSAQVRAAFAGLKPSLAISAGENSTQGASTVTSVTPMRPMAPPGSGSTIRPTMTPAKMAKKYQACCGRPSGAGASASAMTTAMGSKARHGNAAPGPCPDAVRATLPGRAIRDPLG